MAKQSITSTGRKAQTSELVHAEVTARQRLSPHLVRVTLGGGNLRDLVPQGYDQWFRLFLPVSDTSLSRVPQKLDTLSYLRFLTVSRTERPVIRNYTVRAVDSAAGTLDLDVVVHPGEAGPGSTWALTCRPGDPVALLDEGVGFGFTDVRRVALVGDESALPAVAAILESLPDGVTGHAVVEVPHDDDRVAPARTGDVELTWVVRGEGARAGVPGARALEVLRELPVEDPDSPGLVAWAAGEQALASGARRHWVSAGVPKQSIAFCGYWRAGRAAPS